MRHWESEAGDPQLAPGLMKPEQDDSGDFLPAGGRGAAGALGLAGGPGGWTTKLGASQAPGA